jgi:hypothetical protein
VHKAQGTTVDRTYVLATPHFDRHTSYVALSRHRDPATVFYASDDFGGRASGANAHTVKARFTETLSRARPKELAHDYLEGLSTAETATVADLVAREAAKTREAERTATPMDDVQSRQQQAAERWKARQQEGPKTGQGINANITHDPGHLPTHERERKPELRRDGPEDDLEL